MLYRYSTDICVGRELLDHEVDCQQAEGAALATPAVDQHCALLVPGLLDEADHCIDDALVDDGLDAGFGPIEGEEAHALDGGIVLALPACAVDYVCDLVEGEPFDVLPR